MALVAGAATAITTKTASAYWDDDDEEEKKGWHKRREEDRDFHCVWEEFDDCEDKVIKLTEHFRVHVKHFRKDDGERKLKCHCDCDARCDNDNDGYWVESPGWDWEITRRRKDNDCVEPFSHKEYWHHKVWKNDHEDRGTVTIHCEHFMNSKGNHKIDFRCDFKSPCHNKCDDRRWS